MRGQTRVSSKILPIPCDATSAYGVYKVGCPDGGQAAPCGTGGVLFLFVTWRVGVP